MRKYLLSTGTATDRLEYYVLDLFKLYLKIYPGDIPGASGLGFDFNLAGVQKADLPSVISTKVSQLVRTIQGRFKSGVTITLDSVEIVSEEKAKIVVTVNRDVTDDIYINLYESATGL